MKLPRTQRLIARTAGLCLGMATFALSTPVYADVIVSYPLNWSGGNVVETSAPAGSVHPDVTASDYNALGGTEISRSSQTHFIRVDSGDNAAKLATIADSIANDMYGQFEVTVDPGMLLNLSSLEFGMQITRGADTEFFTVHLRSSLDNYASDIDTATLMGDSDVENVDGSALFDLTDAAFQNLTDPIDFRLYMVTDIGSRTDGSNIVRIASDVVLNGTVVPEPSAVALMGLGSLLVLGRRRRACDKA
ncbi:PEP-CTERM sorting domain-containing protein [Phycisphaerales bacterium AB-hyl4]|uniref:PEP-CTERM sorting domain-containing protein n=1 Tax=Natronomicrosphaera hydrolytica TaxID=3242702 RepID=A0ABV4U8F9_9BACT